MCLREVNIMAMYLCWLGKTEKKKQALLLSLLLLLLIFKWQFLAVLSKGFLHEWPSIIIDTHLGFPASH